jgi:tetratricopeptide (TPR) repeat protein
MDEAGQRPAPEVAAAREPDVAAREPEVASAPEPDPASVREPEVAAAREAVSRYRALAVSGGRRQLVSLATALTRLGLELGEAGQLEPAVTAAQEAVVIRRQLAGTRAGSAGTGSADPGLGIALSNLAKHLVEAGHRQQAIPSAVEAVTISRQLARDDPGTFLPELARCLSNLSGILGEAGQAEPAVAAAEEATAISRRLAEADPGNSLDPLATALGNLSNNLARAGQHEAATAGDESVSIFRGLAAADPARYRPGLAAALLNLSTQLADAGQHADAVGPAEEAVSLFRQLAVASPEAGMPRLVGSLRNLTARLRETGQLDRVSTAWEPAIAEIPSRSQQGVLAYLYAEELLRGPDDASTAAFVRILASPAAPEPLTQLAEHMLKSIWTRAPQATEHAWRAVTHAPRPGWMHLTDDDFAVVTAWMATGTLTASSQYFAEHADALLAPSTTVALRVLKSRDGRTEREVDVHQAILVLARGEGGFRAAYACVRDHQAMTAMMKRAIAGRFPDMAYACSVLEMGALQHIFLGTLYALIVALLRNRSALPDGFVARVVSLGASTSAAERDSAVAELRALLDGLTVDPAIARDIQPILALASAS